jgi:hypothetical protein
MLVSVPASHDPSRYRAEVCSERVVSTYIWTSVVPNDNARALSAPVTMQLA